MRRLLVPVLAAALLAACADDRTGNTSSGEDPPPRSGVRGTVEAGPQCPVVVQGSPCPDHPWDGTVQVTTPEGEPVAEADTDARGGFIVELAPGSYDLLPVADDAGPAIAAPQRIVIEDGAFTRVTLTVDTGIR